MGLKTRYLQLSDVIMMEYVFQGEDAVETGNNNGMILTKLLDGHYAVFSPAEYEVDYDFEKYVKRPNESVVSFNTINHLAVPKDKRDSMWFTFLDPDYIYTKEGNVDIYLDEYDPKVFEYSKYCEPAEEGFPIFKEINLEERNLPMDSLKLYFVNGYDFSNIYGILARVSINRKDGGILDLCNFFINNSTLFRTIQFLTKPIIFGNNVYDRYVELRLPSIYHLTSNTAFEDINEILKGINDSTVTLNFSYIDKDSFEIKKLGITTENIIRGAIAPEVDCTFTRSSNIKGNIPSEALNSDNLGIYIAQSPDHPYLEFYGTWKNEPLTYRIVQNFNRNIVLYDSAAVRNKNLDMYEVSEDYSADTNLRKWIAMHEIECVFMNSDNMVLKRETYNMSQVFIDASDETRFYYRPTIFDETLANMVANIHIIYTMRFINTEDMIQFVKNGSLTITGADIARFYSKGTTLNSKNIAQYKVYNKIFENKQEYLGNGIVSPKTKYIKVFYNSSDIVLDDNSGSNYADGDYVQRLSGVPKTYKFIFKKLRSDGKYDYMDLTDGYYKLFTKDAGGNDIVIDPSYSENMNMVLGELEFNISSSVLSRLLEVDVLDRKMSIVSVGDDNTMSSMFDFTYTF